jgi:hypothetical protein
VTNFVSKSIEISPFTEEEEAKESLLSNAFVTDSAHPSHIISGTFRITFIVSSSSSPFPVVPAADVTFYAHEYTTNTQVKHERFFQNLLRSERVQGKRFR